MKLGLSYSSVLEAPYELKALIISLNELGAGITSSAVDYKSNLGFIAISKEKTSSYAICRIRRLVERLADAEVIMDKLDSGYMLVCPLDKTSILYTYIDVMKKIVR